MQISSYLSLTCHGKAVKDNTAGFSFMLSDLDFCWLQTHKSSESPKDHRIMVREIRCKAPSSMQFDLDLHLLQSNYNLIGIDLGCQRKATMSNLLLRTPVPVSEISGVNYSLENSLSYFQRFCKFDSNALLIG